MKYGQNKKKLLQLILETLMQWKSDVKDPFQAALIQNNGFNHDVKIVQEDQMKDWGIQFQQTGLD